MKPEVYGEWIQQRAKRAQAVARSGGVEAALASGALPQRADLTLSEAIVLGLLRQGVRTFVGVFGHGSTELGEVLRVYQEAGLLKTFAVRNEIEATHAATALRWVTGEKAAVVTSIGPGALHALAASLVPASDGLGVWFLLGEETTEDEGPNMQQIPKSEQALFLRLFQTMGEAYTLHTPGAVGPALRRGLNTVDHPHRAGPFFLLMPMNTQCSLLPGFNLNELPAGAPPACGAAQDEAAYRTAAEALAQASRIVVKVGGGGRHAGSALEEFLDAAGAVLVSNPTAAGVIPYAHPRNLCVGGSKGTLCGNYAMEEADLLVAVGMRFVCQSDCSRTGFPKVKRVININTDPDAALHYNRTVALVGDAAATLRKLTEVLRQGGADRSRQDSEWLQACRRKREEWDAFRTERYNTPCLHDEGWGGTVLTQPAAIKIAADWARAHEDVVSFFDAGDVQANGFQIVEDDRPGRTFTDTGASYMGFAGSAVLSSALASKPFYALAFSGDGSFTMNPQILIDGVEHGARGCILVFDNRRMAAITGLQFAQFDAEHATNDSVQTDYVAWAKAIPGAAAFNGGRSPDELRKALDGAYAHEGLSLIHVPVYFGEDPLGGMGVFGRWNVGNWCDEVQALRHEIGL